MASNIAAVGMDTTSGQFKIPAPTDVLVIPTALSGTGGTPTIVLGAAAGTGPSFSIVGSNTAGKVTLNVGTGILTSGTVMTMTFADSLSYPNGCSITFTAGNSNFATVLTTISASTTVTTAILSVAVGLSISTTYIGFYQIIGW